MELRESTNAADAQEDLRVATGLVSGDGGIEHGSYLVRLAEAVALWRWDEVAQLRATGLRRLGDRPTSDAILVAAGFNGITRVADAIGIRLDASTESATVELRSRTGIDQFVRPDKW